MAGHGRSRRGDQRQRADALSRVSPPNSVFRSGTCARASPDCRSGDPVEQEKRITYRALVAKAMMLPPGVDMTHGLRALQQEGISVTPEVVSPLSPYLTEHIKRFGQYGLDIDTQPEPLQPKPLFVTGT